ncbi:aspartate racemase [Pseudomonas duriflava]|uniref:Aspartate racemase n=1 Tax=Pseudomonas duriflava TaxID=459528 RepID=A0A562QG39_9PSED|nr:aspartate/glutamate racemase family protein [Pseudomonas duriflava]TWI55722.1 aspartate racemase [Pseudomonas duriflava]
MHIGLIGGIGPAATEFYYRALVSLYAKENRKLDLTIANADAREMVNNLEAGNQKAQAAIFSRYIDQLRAAGCEAVAVTSMGGHFCIEELESISSLPIINAISALHAYFTKENITKVGVLGTRAVMQSRLYGLEGVDVLTVAENELGEAHAHYVSMAVSGKATDEQRTYFENAAVRLVSEQGAQAIVLGGTDLFLAFDKSSYPYTLVDCALVHAAEIARLGMN